MAKCVVCGQKFSEHSVKVLNPVTIAMNLVANPYNWVESEEYCTESGDPAFCELCVIGLMGSGWRYMWNGTDLMVYDEKEEEFIERRGDRYRPAYPTQIQFEKDKESGKWIAVAR
jgi:hypothetical protein